MLGACNLGDAKERAARALEAFEKSIMGRTGSLLEDLQKVYKDPSFTFEILVFS